MTDTPAAPAFTGPRVYSAIAAVMGDLAKEGISKDRKNQTQGYSFRGIDDVYNALSPILARHNLCMLPRILSRELVERQTAKGNALFYVLVEAEFDLVSSEDGSKHTVRTYGEAMDSADKATNKAMSAAYKYAAMQTFAIPTEGDNDADTVTHEVKNEVGRKSSAQAKRDGDWEALKQEVDACATLEELNLLVVSRPWQETVKRLPTVWVGHLKDYVQGARDVFEAPATGRAPAPGSTAAPPNFDALEPTH
jgi:hypothetical protein